jgi:hypothetical protein
MKTLVVQMACCAAILICAAGLPKASAQVVPTYELYSWEHSKGVWSFSLFYTTDRQKTPEEVFSDKTALHGIKQLTTEMSRLPPSSRVVWFDRLTLNGVKIKGSEQLKYPSKKIIDEVKRYADAHEIKISGPPE